ncbi:hypothetical protein TWF132_011791 [Orbilia oligospora]|nr:hypothetical protein TWF751_003066 [Orbilia oligospora]KAF3280328.1 hypothetical protein TWF132_011791 [Orbilia oligospora]
MASEPTTLPTNQPAPPTASTEGTAQETPNRPRNKRLPGIPRKFYVTIRNLGLIFFVAFPMAHMASWALTIWMLGRGADKLAASLDTTKPFDETVFRNTLRHVVTAGARGWRINVIMLSLETLCAIIGGLFLIRGLRRARRLIIEVEEQRDLEAQEGAEATGNRPAVL